MRNYKKLVPFVLVLVFCTLTFLAKPATTQAYFCDYDYAYRSGYRWWGAEVSYPIWITVYLQIYDNQQVDSCYGQGYCEKYGYLNGWFRVCCSNSPYYPWM